MNKFLESITSGDREYRIIYFVITLLIIPGIYGFYYYISYLLKLFKNKFKNFTKIKTNVFFINELMSKINSKSKINTILCLIIFFSLIAFSIGYILQLWSNKTLERYNIYDLEIDTHYELIKNKKLNIETDFKDIFIYINNKFHIDKSKSYNLYFYKDADFNITKKKKFPILIMKLSDYNDLRKINGYKSINLHNNEFAIHYENIGILLQQLKDLCITQNGINFKNENIQLKNEAFYNEYLGRSIFNNNVEYTIIVNDDLCNDLKVAKTTFIANLMKPIPFNENKIIFEDIGNWYKSKYKMRIPSYEYEQ
ncbi:hypothetical protein [Clostridium sp. Marseille-Q2269]|uniref:hypothetical protein n=1 Tax=Clostridium sp. Marseille-Q2269 TaxID=2942205 RepID=UPI00207354B7|nr:hypothetical protein [Clostridium sp. Marseille-Q2269]